jgi:heme-degrading monooxygenase HmoA
MTFVSITRLRVRSWRFLPGFGLYTVGTLRQCRRAPGFLNGSLLPDRGCTFWTMTLWRDHSAMRAFMVSGEHLKAMPKLLNWCNEASVVHWTQGDAAMPTWQEADRRMRTQGRTSKVRHPSPHHSGLAFAEPRMTGSAPIRPV